MTPFTDVPTECRGDRVFADCTHYLMCLPRCDGSTPQTVSPDLPSVLKLLMPSILSQWQGKQLTRDQVGAHLLAVSLGREETRLFLLCERVHTCGRPITHEDEGPCQDWNARGGPRPCPKKPHPRNSVQYPVVGDGSGNPVCEPWTLIPEQL